MKTLLAALVLLLMACTPRASDTLNSSTRDLTLVEQFPNLTAAVQAQPRVRVTNQQAFLQTAAFSSVNANTELQFVVEGVFIGGLASAEQAISLVDVERLRVLDALEGGARYGLRGGNGVIVLELVEEEGS